MKKSGKVLSIRVYVSAENLEKLERVQNYLNNQNDVISGDVPIWEKKDVYEHLFNQAIEDFKC